MKFKNGFPAVTSIFKRHALAAAGLRYASVEVTGELKLIVAVSVDAGARIDVEGERCGAGATNVGDVVRARIMRSNITLGSLCCRILS